MLLHICMYILCLHLLSAIEKRMTPRSINDLVIFALTFVQKISLSDLVATKGIVFHKHMDFRRKRTENKYKKMYKCFV